MADTKTWWLDADNAVPKFGNLPAKANTITEGGRIAWSDASGYAIPSSSTTAASKAWGIYLTHVDNSTGTLTPGNSGLNNGVPTGVPFQQGYALCLGDGSVTAANVGQYVYLVSDSGTGKPTVGISDAGGTRPLVGFVSPYVRTSSDVDPSAIPIAIGFARPDALDPELAGQNPAAYRMRGVVTANVSNLASFTVAGNDGLTYTAGQQVLLVGQTTASQNGPYVVGTVTTGAAPLTRPDWWATGSTQPPAALFMVNEGTQGANSEWLVRTAGSLTVDTTAVNIDMIDGNWVQGVSTAVGTMAGQTNFFFAGALLKARLSGIFYVDLDVAWSDGTTADSVTLALITDTSASGTLASANKVAHGVAGLGAYGTNGADWESVDTNAGATLTYNGAAWNTAAVTQASEINATLTGLLTANGTGTQKFGFHGIVYNAAPTGTTKTPFTIGNTVAFGVKVSSTNTITVPSVRLTVRELSNQ